MNKNYQWFGLLAGIALTGCGSDSDSDSPKRRSSDQAQELKFSLDMKNTLSEKEALEAFAEFKEDFSAFRLAMPGLPCPGDADDPFGKGLMPIKGLLEIGTMNDLTQVEGIAPNPNEKGYQEKDEPNAFAISYTEYIDSEGTKSDFTGSVASSYQYGGNDNTLFIRLVSNSASKWATPDQKMLNNTAVRQALLEYDRTTKYLNLRTNTTTVTSRTNVFESVDTGISLPDLEVEHRSQIRHSSPKTEQTYSSNYRKDGDQIAVNWDYKYTGGSGGSPIGDRQPTGNGMLTIKPVDPSNTIQCIAFD